MPHEEAWLVRVLVNICRDEWRKQAVRKPHDAAARADRTARRGIARSCAKRWSSRRSQALPPRRRAILVMYELEGAAIPAIAQLLGIRAVTVRWHLSVGRSEMARLIGKRS